VIQVAKGNAFLIKKDIFKNLMWYTLPDSNKQYPLTIERVKKIKSLNQEGTIPDELGVADVTSSKPKEAEPEFVELVGQISLSSLDKAADKKRKQQQQGTRNREQGTRNKGQGGQQGQQGGNQPDRQAGQQRQQGGKQQRPQRKQQRPDNPNRNPRNQQRPPNKPDDKK
jgi:hypothetical protein